MPYVGPKVKGGLGAGLRAAAAAIRRHPWRSAALALLFSALVLGIAHRAALGAQARAAVVLSTTLRAPVLAWTVERLTDRPRVQETVVAGAPTTLVRPGKGDGPWPAVVFLNGATRLGRRHPDVQRLARGLARAGYLVLVPDLPGLPQGEITGRTAAATLAVARAASGRPDARAGRVALVGVSVGASLALLAAEEPSLAGRVSVVAGVAPFTDLPEVVRLAITGRERLDGRLVAYHVDPYVSLAIGRSLAAALPRGSGGPRLLAELERVDDDAADPLAAVRGRALGDLGPGARAVARLLANRDPRRFDGLYAALPARVRAGLERLSPANRAGRLRARVELVSAPHDKYFPLTQSRALVRRARDAHLTVTPTLQHAIPKPSLHDLAGLVRFEAFVARVLRAAATDPSPV